MQSPLQQLLPALVRSFADNRKQIWILNSNKSKKDDGFCSRNLFMHKIFISKADQIYLLDIRYAEVCFFFPNLQLNEVTFCTTDSSLTVMNLVQRKDTLSAHVYYIQNTKKEELAHQYSTLKYFTRSFSLTLPPSANT